MFDSYQEFGGDYALIVLVNSASDFIYYVYSFARHKDRNALNCLGVSETLLLLYCFAYLGNRLEFMVLNPFLNVPI